MKNVDFVAQMELFLEALFKDAAAGKNAIVFNYNPNYPRYLSFEAHKLIGAIKNLSRYYLKEVTNSKLSIIFNIVNYSLTSVHFDIYIKCTTVPLKQNKKLINEADVLLSELNAHINQIVDGFCININIPLPKSGTFKKRNSKISNLSGKNAIIACEDKDIFSIISHELSFHGLKLNRQKSFESLNLHIKDAIFKPDIIFVQKEYLSDKARLDEMLTYQKLKNFYIIIISKDEAKSIKSEKMTTLRQPFTSDSLHETLEIVARNL